MANSDRVEWSNSGEWTVYEAQPGGNLDIYRTRVDGSGAQRLTSHPASDISPTWSPPISLAWRGWVNALAGFALLFVWTVAAVRV